MYIFSFFFFCLSAFVHDSFFSVICSSGFAFLVCLSHIWCSVNNFDTIFLVVFSLPHMWTISTTNLAFSLFYFPGSSSSLSAILRFSCSCFLFLFSAWLVCCVLIFSFACFEYVFCSYVRMWVSITWRQRWPIGLIFTSKAHMLNDNCWSSVRGVSVSVYPYIDFDRSTSPLHSVWSTKMLYALSVWRQRAQNGRSYRIVCG